MTYTVKEIYYTLQGEGAQAGRPAVFLRFAGCNLWSGREKDRSSAVCKFCDTEFVGTDGPGGGKFMDANALTEVVKSYWPVDGGGKPYVVCTGGEPLLQLDSPAISTLHSAGFEIGVETNGTIAAPEGIDWLCVSPKAAAGVTQIRGNELKLVYPQAEEEADPMNFAQMEFDHYFLQPLDDKNQEDHIRAAIRYCLDHPQWKLSLQTHKITGIP